MQRREFLKLSGGAAATLANGNWAIGQLTGTGSHDPGDSATFYVSPSGNDDNPGSLSSPFATLHQAQQAMRKIAKRTGPLTVFVREGTYYFDSPLLFGPEDSGSKDASVTYGAYPNEKVTLSAGRRLECNWVPYRDGIMMTQLPSFSQSGTGFTQLFINGKRKIRARYPNYDASDPGKSGYLVAAGAISPETPNPHPGPNEDMTFSGQAQRGIRFDPSTFTKKHWANPEDAEIHIFQAAYWGNLQWRIKEIDPVANSIWFGEGGQQIGAKWSKNPAFLTTNHGFSSTTYSKSSMHLENGSSISEPRFFTTTRSPAPI